jgi:hypothetical protein
LPAPDIISLRAFGVRLNRNVLWNLAATCELHLLDTDANDDSSFDASSNFWGTTDVEQVDVSSNYISTCEIIA